MPRNRYPRIVRLLLNGDIASWIEPRSENDFTAIGHRFRLISIPAGVETYRMRKTAKRMAETPRLPSLVVGISSAFCD